MIIKALAENTALSEDYQCEHGLSLYVETTNHKILFDMGKTEIYLHNARKMSVDISGIDLAVISHGHYDHGGGLNAFLQVNKKAKVYLHKKAFEEHYSQRPNSITADIGLQPALKTNDQIILTNNNFRIDDELELLSTIEGNELCSLSNKVLLMKDGDSFVEDSFEHEQSLIITEGSKTLLIAGCAHKGIVNIVKQFIQLKGTPPDYVIGGFHLFNPSTLQSEDQELISEVGKYLKETGSMYYTCHCTGIDAYTRLKEVMGENIQYLATGSVVEFKA